MIGMAGTFLCPLVGIRFLVQGEILYVIWLDFNFRESETVGSLSNAVSLFY